MTPLYVAVSVMDKEYIEKLVNAGANINTQDTLVGESILMKAIEGRAEKEIINYLISQGANVNIEDKHGSTALILAMKHYSDIDIVKSLIKAGADVNKGSDLMHGNALMCAYWNLVPENIIELLIENGADTTIKDREGTDMETYRLYWEEKMN